MHFPKFLCETLAKRKRPRERALVSPEQPGTRSRPKCLHQELQWILASSKPKACVAVPSAVPRSSRRSRTAFTPDQLGMLQAVLETSRCPDWSRVQELASELHLDVYVIKVCPEPRALRAAHSLAVVTAALAAQGNGQCARCASQSPRGWQAEAAPGLVPNFLRVGT